MTITINIMFHVEGINYYYWVILNVTTTTTTAAAAADHYCCQNSPPSFHIRSRLRCHRHHQDRHHHLNIFGFVSVRRHVQSVDVM